MVFPEESRPFTGSNTPELPRYEETQSSPTETKYPSSTTTTLRQDPQAQKVNKRYSHQARHVDVQYNNHNSLPLSFSALIIHASLRLLGSDRHSVLGYIGMVLGGVLWFALYSFIWHTIYLYAPNLDSKLYTTT